MGHPKIFDLSHELNPELSTLVSLMRKNGCNRLFFKRLSPNDNSKNQPWVGNHLLEIDFFPCKEINARKISESGKRKVTKRSQIFEVSLDLHWLDATGNTYNAPNAKLIYYPQYPEVRLSGFLQGSPLDSNGWFTHEIPEKGRADNRVLIFGTTDKEELFAYLALPGSNLSTILLKNKFKNVSEFTKVFFSLPLDYGFDSDNRTQLIAKMREIYNKGWIASKRLDRTGKPNNYTAGNGVGYTLEAELDITPNGNYSPDYLGWEVKAFTVKKEDTHLNNETITVMTPEPTGGFYHKYGAKRFVMEYGHETKVSGKYYFTGCHTCKVKSKKTGFKMELTGFDEEKNELIDVDGYLALVDSEGTRIAIWHFSKILQHWMKKHAKAIYVPALHRIKDDKIHEYSYSDKVHLFMGTSIEKLLKSYSNGYIYYDPAVKVEDGRVKARNQFRIKFKDLQGLYNSYEIVCLDK